jgi:hypothetical protein
VRLADGRLIVSPRAPATLQLASLSWADDVRVNGLEVRLPPAAAPLLSAELADGRMRWQQHGQELDRGRVVLSGGAVRAPEHQLRLSGIAADMRLSAHGLDPA